MGLLSGLKNFTVGAARIAAPLGESIGSALAGGEAQKLEDDRIQRQLELDTAIQEQARRTTDSKKKERLIQIAKTNRERSDTSGIISSVEEFQETPLQTLGKAGLTASNAILLGQALGSKATGALAKGTGLFRTKPAVDFIAGAGGIQKVSRAANAGRLALNTAKTFGVGAGFGALFALQEGETDPNEIAKEAGKFGAINVVLPPAIGKTLGVTGRLISKTLGATGKQLGKGINKLEQLAEEPIKNTANQLDDFINIAHGNRFTPTMESMLKRAAGKTADVGRTLQNLPSRLKTIVVDRMNPIRDLSKQASEVLGRPISFKKDPYFQARRTSGIIDGTFDIASGKQPVNRNGLQKLLDDGTIDQDQFDNAIFYDDIGQSFKSIVNDFKKVDNEASGYVAAKNASDRLKLGQKVVRGKTAEQTDEAIRLAEKSDKFELIKKYDDLVKNITDKVLEIRRRGGLVSEELIKKLKKTHPNYVPNKVLDFFEEGGETLGRLINPAEKKLSVTTSGIKRAKGSEREIMNPIEAMIVDLKKAITDSERNKVANKILDLGEEVGEKGGYKKIEKIMDVAESVLHIPGKNVFAKINKKTLDFLKDEVKNITLK